MKLTAAFLVLSMVVLMAQPSEGFLGLLFNAIPHIIKGISSLAGGVEEQAVQQEVDQDVQQLDQDLQQEVDQDLQQEVDQDLQQLDQDQQQELDQLDLDLQQLDQDQQQELDQLEQKKLNQKLVKLLHK
ncbi:dicentracin [Nothobranchius furzeri]|uniref:Transcript variant X1 n=1 Tax=Nothobranchius furzeri TaxID=105023 RepID=A0A9D2Z1C1_NOTFU|nr:transcript variant X2 [Nothobranchius furzeri]KAF7230850.1 transcript variant X1 [Nothobranchius furzeri]